MNRLTRTLLALALTLLMLFPLCATALAASTATCAEDLRLSPYSFPSSQYYDASGGEVDICTIQIAAGGSYAGAISRANELVAKGLDGFVLYQDGMFYVMSGKFYYEYDALCYGELIHTDPNEQSAYMVPAKLPKRAVDVFQGIFYDAVRLSRDSQAMETHWEQPTGAFYRADEGETIEVYTVQMSRGTCFPRCEFLRDRMERYGYPAFVYKVDLSYKTMTGMFLNRNEAKAYCKLIRRNTKENDAIVKSAFVPVSEYESFVEWWSDQK